MKKRINLFKKEDRYVHLDETLRKVNNWGTGVAVLLFVSFLGLFAYNFFLSTNLIKLTTEKESLSKQLDNTNTQFKINYVANKTDQLKLYSKQDAHFTQYFNQVKDVLDTNGMPAVSSFEVDNKQEVSFSFRPFTYEEFKTILAFVESDPFTSLFKTLTISSGMYDNATGIPLITLKFTGTMKHVDTAI